ncbi:hypothetical protein [Leucobacter sp. M11]|uniref:hypothetical protein n=1 Tax=Leucobacter sp. M11 TaxID=2993565 RepID=UPI002D7E2C18|nr:hypothetical protein [Leucobacter sp. M11]MEB4613986.1 hypothetical protein [Leucobacter sp. M11]
MSSDFESASLSELDGDVQVRSATLAVVKDLDDKEGHQRLGFRSAYFWASIALAAITVGTSAALVVGMVFFGRGIAPGSGIEPAIVIAFISGLAVETIGVLLLLGGNLFPNGKS